MPSSEVLFFTFAPLRLGGRQSDFFFAFFAFFAVNHPIPNLVTVKSITRKTPTDYL
jgi:hypothetical protein